MEKPYIPISCSVYDVLEVAAMKKRRLIFTIGGIEQELLVLDVYARGKEEYLEGVDPLTNIPHILRLDTIESLFDPVDQKLYSPKAC